MMNTSVYRHVRSPSYEVDITISKVDCWDQMHTSVYRQVRSPSYILYRYIYK